MFFGNNAFKVGTALPSCQSFIYVEADILFKVMSKVINSSGGHSVDVDWITLFVRK